MTEKINTFRVRAPLSVALVGLVTVWLSLPGDVNGWFWDGLPCEFRDSINISSGVRDGQENIFHRGIRYSPKDYALVNYAFEGLGNEQQVDVPAHYRGCVCHLTNCVRLCCPLGQWFYIGSGPPVCQPASANGSEFKVLAKVNDGNGTRVTDLLENSTFGYVDQRPCSELIDEEYDDWLVDDSGSVLNMGEFLLSHKDYCLAPREGNETTLLMYCPMTEESRVPHVIGIFVSIPFLIVTLAIYICIPELRNIHGKSLICHVFALLCVYVLLLLTNFRLTSGWCKIQGFTLYFWLLVCFFWLNVMCFDIFWTFSSGVLIKNEKRRFLYYSLYAWGVPVLFTGAALMVEHLDAVPLHIKPRFGENEDVLNCFLQRDMAIEFIYFYFPLCIVVVSNVYFFGMTAFRIFRIQRATEAALRHDSKRHSKFEKDRYRFSLYLRLFVVMGITWTFEILSWASQSELWFFYLADICNCLLGVIIFFLFVWKQKVRQLVVKRIGRHQEPSRSKSSVNTASFTTGTTKSSSGHEAAVPMNPIATRTSELATDSA
ncbi:G-protein coupled receptor Mth2-like isoform X2 [Uranotaenia lowii]|uniref:G-protein coupled receptor Mth2-like isoform X2 n=1 Tax=Uranotaenia lowii TaxID=190385 RepID=UPI00247AF399|nr:G-protein coupled receptor Mth2-like isoform X2 [Uranotaenia lowii]